MKTALDSIREEIELGRPKFEADEMTDEHLEAAKEFIVQYTSDFVFVLEMRTQLIKKGTLTAGQIKGVLNVFRAEVNREIESKKAKLEQLVDGEYTIGEWKFRLATQPADADFAPGETLIQYPGKKKPWIGFGFVRGTKLQAWSRFRDDWESKEMLEAASNLLAGKSAVQAVA